MFLGNHLSSRDSSKKVISDLKFAISVSTEITESQGRLASPGDASAICHAPNSVMNAGNSGDQILFRQNIWNTRLTLDTFNYLKKRGEKLPQSPMTHQ